MASKKINAKEIFEKYLNQDSSTSNGDWLKMLNVSAEEEKPTEETKPKKIITPKRKFNDGRAEFLPIPIKPLFNERLMVGGSISDKFNELILNSDLVENLATSLTKVDVDEYNKTVGRSFDLGWDQFTNSLVINYKSYIPDQFIYSHPDNEFNVQDEKYRINQYEISTWRKTIEYKLDYDLEERALKIKMTLTTKYIDNDGRIRQRIAENEMVAKDDKEILQILSESLNTDVYDDYEDNEQHLMININDIPSEDEKTFVRYALGDPTDYVKNFSGYVINQTDAYNPLLVLKAVKKFITEYSIIKILNIAIKHLDHIKLDSDRTVLDVIPRDSGSWKISGDKLK